MADLMPCRKHDWELTGTRVGIAFVAIEVCARCGEERARVVSRWAFATAVIDRAKHLARRGLRGRQARFAFEDGGPR